MITNDENLKLCGVYQIRNLITGKVYIGSTTESFNKRFSHHKYCLLNNKHKNSYLQNAWNKYSESNFIFEILEILNKEDCLIIEQKYLDLIKFKYNINPVASGTPNMSLETIQKRTKTLKKYWQINGTDKLKGNIPWNKGKKYISTDHLKVPKKITEKSAKKRAIVFRNKLKAVEVYDFEGNLLGIWKNAYELEEYSKTEANNLPIKSRFHAEIRMNVPKNHLQYVNIIKAARTNEPYKGLFFKYVPSL